MSLKALSRQVNRLQRRVRPSPIIIDCTGAADALIAKLLQYAPMPEGPPSTRTAEEEEEFQHMAKGLKAALAESIAENERKYNVRYISRDNYH